MALSQVQCLDNNHVNWRSSEAKPEFFYSEEQRLALEALASRGPDAFYEVLKKENIRDFLSELELKKILETLETYDPGSEYPSRGEKSGDGGSQDGEQGPLPSLEYWPERSDRSIPQLDLGWPESVAYRGVTRATVYMQPPIDFQPHIKEVVRKMIFQAQKVVAVVMDMFTDVDIFKDLLDAGFKRKVAVYIILDESNLKYFLQMCERAQMHAGHLKNLRVCTMGGTEFFTRSATRFKGALAQKFMFVDGDKAMSGSYSFTWSAARTDRNVISVLSGQVVEAFDKQFQELYLLSRGVSLKSIPMDEEPEPDPMPLPSAIPVTPANSVVKKMVNPKYALVKAKSVEQIANSDHASSDQNLTDRPRAGAKGKGIAEGQVSERPSEFSEMLAPVHPGLLNLEKANMFDYLPTWVEPDPEPGSEVLGYINIIDPKIKNIQLSQMNRIKVCDVAQAKAQHREMLKQKMQDGQKNQSNQAAPASPCHFNPTSGSVQSSEAPNTMGHIQETPNTVGQIQEVSNTTGHNQEAPKPTGHNLEAPNATGHNQETPNATRHNQEAPNPMGHIQETPKAIRHNQEAPKPKPNLTEHNQESPNATGHIQETPNATRTNQEATKPVGHNQKAPNATREIQGTPHPSPSKRIPKKPNPGDAFATLAFSEHLKQPPWTKAHEPTADNRVTPPVPKPRTVHMTGLISLKNEPDEGGDAVTEDAQLETGSASPKHKGSPAKAEDRGTHGKLTRQEACPVNGMQGGEADEDEEEDYLTLSDQESLSSSSTAHSRQHSNASSVSDEYFEGPQLFCYGSRVQLPTGCRKTGTPAAQRGRIPGDSQYQRDGGRAKKGLPGRPNNGFGKHSQPSRPLQGNIQGTGSFSRATGGVLSPFHESQRVPEEIRTPLGIPLSKLSQSKHLKHRVSQLSDPKRKPHGTTSHKDQ
ncbi:protein FAM83G isoform X2 [Paroedura picta]|uniref:protein FAM83G isoform X2 n=1 Tax=Paroedura picta TaxID=143630 RepID=UPI0040571009